MRIEIPKLLEKFGGDLSAKLKRLVDNQIKKIHTTTIGVIESFDAETQTAVIQPAIKRVIGTETEHTIVYTTENYPLLVNVPVVFPGGGDWFMTFPIKRGDECLLFSMERSIGNWKQNGGVQEPSQYKRKLSFKDTVAMVGLNSKASSLPEFNPDEPELRNRDGSVKIKLGEEGIDLISTTNIKLSADEIVELNGTNGIKLLSDDSIELMSSVDNAVRYSALETAYNTLKTDLNNLVTKYNTDMAAITAGASAAVSASGLWLTPLVIGGGSPSTGDITGAKVDEITVP